MERARRFVVILVFLLGSSVSVGFAQQTRSTAGCPPTPGVAPANDVARGRCLFHSTAVFGQDPQGPFASCAICHYGEDKSDHAVHLVQITNASDQTIQVLRKTPSLLKARFNFPYGWDGRLPTVQDAARGAILSPVEMNGRFVSQDQLDALAAFVLTLPESESNAPPAPMSIPEPSADTLRRIAVGKTIFFGRGACFTCHPAPNFTNNTITSDQFFFNFTGVTDPAAGFVGTGPAGFFKVPSLLYLGADRPFMHNGAMGTLVEIVRFYNRTLLLNLTGPEMTGLEYWLRNCLDPRRGPQPSTC